jgi:hypothetical protein
MYRPSLTILAAPAAIVVATLAMAGGPLVGVSLFAADPDESTVTKAWLAVCDKQAAEFAISAAATPDKPFRRIAQPVFRHAQPARGNDVGAVWLWVDDKNRPVAVGDIFAWSINDAPVRSVTHEFHSLADVPLVGSFEGSPRWTPKAAGLVWKPVPDGPVPGKSKADRQRQARDLARGFSANSVDFQSGRWELRLIPRPVHQYDVDGGDRQVSGALFAMCQGTDPELWLAIETRPTSEGARWHFAFASFTDYEVQARHDSVDVWSCPKYVHGINTEPHFVDSVAQQVSLPSGEKLEQ